MFSCDQYLVPQTLDEALASMGRHRGAYRVVAGATDTLPATRAGRWGDLHVPVVVDISGIDELRRVELQGDRIWIGATTSIQRFLDSPLLREHLPVMPCCAVWFADDQLREAATLGGNIVNASPAADATPPLIAMNATVVLVRRDGGERRTRTMRLENFITGPATTQLQEGELVVGFECDSMAGYGAAFEKVGPRRSLVLSTVCVAALVRPDRDGQRFEDARLAVGAIGPTPARLDDCERALIGEKITRDVIRRAASLASTRVQSRSRRAYRSEVVANFVEQALLDALAHGDIRFDAPTPAVEMSYV